MPDPIRRGASWVLARVPAGLTFALLVALGVWGSRTGWKLPSLSALGASRADDEPDPSASAVKVTPDPSAPASDETRSVSPPRSLLEFPSAEAVRQAGIRVAPVEVRPLARYVTAYGMLDYDPSYYAELATRAPGTVWHVYKEIGEPVRKGEALALIESADVGKAKADFLQSLTQLDVRQQALQRLRSAGGSVPEGTLREAEASLREARIRLFNHQQRLLNLGLPIRLGEVTELSEDKLVRHLRLLGLPEAVRQGVDPETLTANLLPLTAPFDGQVVSRRAAPGEVVSPSQPQFVVADVHRIHIDLDVHPEDMAHVRVGQAVTFELENQQGAVARGQVSHISPEVNEKSRNVVVHAEAPNPDAKLRPHAFGTGRILISEQPRAVVVPTEAVQSDGRSSFVFVRVSDVGFQSRPVEPGLREGGYTEVHGVQPGEAVVTAGSHALKSELLKDRIGGEE
jgi:cobalt-zinc-cadmium efflux system membrane fusion protein